MFRCVPYISWVLPLYFVTQSWGIYDTYIGLLLPHIAVHICFFSWLMKGFFDGIDPSMEHAALIDGCTRWGAFLRVALPSAIPAISALAVLCWLFTWNEFLFALILTGNQVPVITVVMAQFVTEMGTALEPDGGDGGDGAGAGLPAGAVRPEIRDPGLADLK